jgi:hypothetical protein
VARTKTSRATPAGPRTTKISITVDARVLRSVQKEARRAGRTLSAEVTEALARDLRRRRLQELLQEYETEHGAISDDELARIRARWQA